MDIKPLCGLSRLSTSCCRTRLGWDLGLEEGATNAGPEAAHFTSSSLTQFPVLTLSFNTWRLATRSRIVTQIGRTSCVSKIICKPS